MCKESEYSVAAKAGGRRLVIVESPTKATKIASFLGDGYIVESSRGHVRDLPTGAAEVPAKYKGEKWARTGVNVDNGFEAAVRGQPGQAGDAALAARTRSPAPTSSCSPPTVTARARRSPGTCCRS